MTPKELRAALADLAEIVEWLCRNAQLGEGTPTECRMKMYRRAQALKALAQTESK